MVRPTSYSAERAKRICDLVAEGESLRTISEMRGMPARRTVRGWLNAHPEFEREYEVARRERTDNLVDESIEIADSVSGCTDPTAVQAARLRIDTRRWLASKLLPERFGDHKRVEMTGKAGAPLIPVETGGPSLALALLAVLHDSPAARAHAAERPAWQPAGGAPESGLPERGPRAEKINPRR
jgi:hypothetical protein